MTANLGTGDLIFSTDQLKAYRNNVAVGSATVLQVTAAGKISGNCFAGSVTLPGESGSVSGNFYGPNAEQAGGTYNMTDNARRSQVGAFIMQRQRPAPPRRVAAQNIE